MSKTTTHIPAMEHDWEGRFDEFRSICEVIYLPRTKGISITEIINDLKSYDCCG